MRIRARAWEWLAPVLITVLAALPRLIALGHPHELVFDETYYVKDAWSLWHLGYEGEWPENADEDFLAGDTSTFSDAASYVVHPPLGKWIIALGMALLGPESGWGWRLATAVIGTAMVPVLYLIARRLSGSIAVGAVAAGLLAVDGLGIAMSRVALLDGFLAFFILLAVLFLVLDREGTRRRLQDARGELLGPVLWWRPWVLAAAVSLGAASAVKWSGLYALAGLGIWLVVSDALDRRRAGIRVWLPSAIARQGPASFLLLVPLAAATHLAAWSGWFLSDGGYDRQSDPNPLTAWWNYQSSVYGFHVELSSGHPYASPAWQWPLLIRPTAMRSENPADGVLSVIGSHPNPIVWYAGMAAIVYLVVTLIRTAIARRSDPAARSLPALAWPLVGVAITWLPWLLYPQRTVFQFYTVTMLPFVCLAIALALQHLTRERELILLPEPTPAEVASARRYADRQQRSWRVAAAWFLALALVVAVFFLPLSTGIPEPYLLWRMHMWLPSWI